MKQFWDFLFIFAYRLNWLVSSWHAMFEWGKDICLLGFFTLPDCKLIPIYPVWGHEIFSFWSMLAVWFFNGTDNSGGTVILHIFCYHYYLISSILECIRIMSFYLKNIFNCVGSDVWNFSIDLTKMGSINILMTTHWKVFVYIVLI